MESIEDKTSDQEINETVEDEEIESPNKPKGKKTQNTPFQRVKETEVEFVDERLKNNSYWAKGGDSWGKQANEDLIQTRGKGFRRAKTKKKKGTYRGGYIDLGVNSIKFSDD